MRISIYIFLGILASCFETWRKVRVDSANSTARPLPLSLDQSHLLLLSSRTHLSVATQSFLPPLHKQVILVADKMTAEQRKAVIKNADMSESMQQDAVDCASQALAKYNIEKVRRCDRYQSVSFEMRYSEN
jgi:hypothetical protein